MSDTKKYILLFKGECEKSEIVGLLESLSVSVINPLTSINYPMMVAAMTEDQRAAALSDPRILSIEIEDESFTDQPAPTLVDLKNKKIVGDVNDLPSVFDGTDYLGSMHYYATNAFTNKPNIQFGESATDVGIVDLQTFQAYSTGKNVDIVILETSTDNTPGTVEALYADYDNHPDFMSQSGNSRIKLVDWSFYSPTVTSAWNNQLNGGVKHSRHGSGSITVAGGRYSGLAKEANLYILHTESGVDTLVELVDAVTLFHQTKPVNVDTGFRNPTILSMSLGYPLNLQYMLPIDDISQINLFANQGDTTPIETITKPDAGWTDVSAFIENGMTVRLVDGVWCTSTKSDRSQTATYIALSGALTSAVNAGVHVFKAAGNEGIAFAKNGQKEIETEVVFTGTSGFDPLTNAPITVPAGTYKTLLPQIGNNVAGVNYVGAQYISTSQRRLEEYSNRGPGVTVLGAGSSFAGYVSDLPSNPSKYDSNGVPWGRFNGTSCAAPSVAGLAACLIENYYNQTGLYPAPEVVSEMLSVNSFESVVDNYRFDFKQLPATDPDLIWGIPGYPSPARPAWGMFGASNTFTFMSDDIRLFTNVEGANIQDIQITLPKKAEAEPPVPKFFFGLNTSNSLSEIESESKALVNLGLDINDLDVIRGVRSVGLDRDDFQTISGLNIDVVPELASVADSFVGSTQTIKQIEGTKVYSEFKITSNAPLASKGYKYKYVDFDSASLKVADVSTSRISSWSSFSDVDQTVPIYYGGDVEVSPNQSTSKSTISLSQLTTTVEPEVRKYAAEVPTDLVTITVDGVDYQVYAMRGIPIKFDCTFRRLFLGQITHKIVKLTENDPNPTWTITNKEDGSLFEFEDLEEKDTIQFYDFRLRERELKFYYPPAQIEELNISGIFTREFPPITIDNLKVLDISRNDFIEMPDIQFIAPKLEYLDVSSQNLMRSRNNKTAKEQFDTLPTTLKTLIANGCITTNTGIQSEVPDFSNLTNLESVELNAQGTRITLRLGERIVMPKFAENYVNHPIVDIQDGEAGEFYKIVDLGDWGQTEWEYFDYPYNVLQAILQEGKTPIVRCPKINFFVNLTANPPQIQKFENDIPLTDVNFTGHTTSKAEGGRRIHFSLFAANKLENITIDQISGKKGPFESGSEPLQQGYLDYNFDQEYEYFGPAPIEPWVSKELKTVVSNGNYFDYLPDMSGRTQLTEFQWSQTTNDILTQIDNEVTTLTKFKPFEGCTSLRALGVQGVSNLVDIRTDFQGLPSLTDLTFVDVPLFERFTSETFAGTPQLRTITFSSANFCRTIGSATITNYNLFDSSDCFKTIPAIENITISGLVKAAGSGSLGGEVQRELYEDAKGLLPDFSFNIELKDLTIEKLGIQGGLTDLKENTNLELLVISETNLNQSIPKFVLPRLKSLVLASNKLVSSVENPFPTLICRSLVSLNVENNVDLSGPITTFSGCPFIEQIQLNDCSFTSYNARAFANLTRLNYLKVDKNKLRVADIRQILKDLYISYQTNPRKFALINLSNQNPNDGIVPSLNAVLSDVAAAQAYNILTKIGNWSITI